MGAGIADKKEYKKHSNVFPCYLNIENCVGRLLILNLLWQRPSRSILTAFPFSTEFRKIIIIFKFICYFFQGFFILFNLEIGVGYIILTLVWERLS